MANTKSAKKSMKVQERRRARNQLVRTKVRTFLKRANHEIAENNKDAANEMVTKAVSEIDKAVAKGVVHKNQAARKKSRLMKKFAAL